MPKGKYSEMTLLAIKWRAMSGNVATIPLFYRKEKNYFSNNIQLL